MRLVAALLLVGLLAVSSVRGHTPLGSKCATVNANDFDQCCADKAAAGENDDTCPNLVGSSCSTVTPGDNLKCCKGKVEEDREDSWCQETYPELYLDGGPCGTVTPGDEKKCCKTKIDNDESDLWCEDNYPELYSPPGSTCASVNPDNFDKCCDDKAAAGESDDTCPSAPPPSSNYADYPYMAYIESPNAPKGVCGGSLVAPGYVLTAAQCVFKDGSTAEAADVKAWVDGKEYTIQMVLVDTDNAQFSDFQNPKSDNSWDVAMLALSTNSDAKYVALPLSDVPAMGEWINTSAWMDAGSNVQTAMVPVWDGCPPSWADEFCAGGGGFLHASPEDKGSPAMAGNTQVGLTSGPGCDGTSSDYGYFLKLANKGILEQITVWLNSRGSTGLDENIQSWLIEANTYLYSK